MTEANSLLSSADSQMQLTLFDLPEVKSHALSSGKTYQGCCPVRITHSDASWLDSLGKMVTFNRQGKDGRTLVACMDQRGQRHGGPSTPNISEWPNAAVVCSLSQVLEATSIPARYYLSARACAGILRRAEKRGKTLPPALMRALVATTRGGAIDVAPSLLAQPGSGWKGDFESETFVADVAGTIIAHHGNVKFDHALTCQLVAEVAPTLAANGKAAGSATQQDAESGALIVEPLPFDTTQMTSKANYSNPQPGDPCHPLAAGAHPPAVCVTGEQTHTLTAEGHDASEDGTGRGTPIAICMGSDPIHSHDLALPHTCRHGDPGTIAHRNAVRRLTPVECERLQGFPDNYTLIPAAKAKRIEDDYLEYLTEKMPGMSREEAERMSKDGPRYKALGNSWAVPCARWIGERIQNHIKGQI